MTPHLAEETFPALIVLRSAFFRARMSGSRDFAANYIVDLRDSWRKKIHIGYVLVRKQWGLANADVFTHIGLR
jgi:hypothetical protein